MTLDRFDSETRALVLLAAAIAGGREDELTRAVAGAASLDPRWVEELLLQSVLMVGWPRTLIATAAWRRVHPQPVPELEPGADYARHAEWGARGEAVCRQVYGRNYERLRANVRALHPALEGWMITDGYGRTLGRPGLDLARRELCVVAQVAVQEAERQLHAHLRGALHAGASPAVVEAALQAVAPALGPGGRALAGRLWAQVRP